MNLSLAIGTIPDMGDYRDSGDYRDCSDYGDRDGNRIKS